MAPTDVPPTPHGLPNSPPHVAKDFRLTLQFLHAQDENALIFVGGEHNLDARTPWEQTHPDAPSALLLDYAYGVGIMRRWCTDEFKEYLQKTKETRYPAINSAAQHAQRQHKRELRTEARCRDHVDDEYDMFVDDILEFSYSMQQPFIAAYMKGAAEAKHEKIQRWLNDIENA
ncbi:hypothetical protein EWM64_g5602 [Hericium alpestre]|uniref:Uncharacterized protein n=1 Tax=Hericium alpestre TaxID=135208 RepID=A0A4Y9ZUD2_9AGAM|nr:hypothetical protein EWM64_g5602 [Hericium alpestre]